MIRSAVASRWDEIYGGGSEESMGDRGWARGEVDGLVQGKAIHEGEEDRRRRSVKTG